MKILICNLKYGGNMLVKNEINGKTFEKLIDYAYDKCDYVSFKYYFEPFDFSFRKGMDVILSTPGFTKDDIIKNFSDSYLDKAYEYFKNNDKIFDETYLNDDSDIAEFRRLLAIKNSINMVFYNHVKEVFIEKFKHNLVSEQLIDVKEEDLFDRGILYIFKFNEEMKKEILTNKSLYDWCQPKYLDDIAFIKGNDYWLYSITSREYCDILCENEKELEYLKTIGIEFKKDEFVSHNK